MAQRSNLVTIMTRTARELEKQEKAQLREQTRIAKEAERAQKAYLRAQEQAAKTAIKERQAQEKERARLYTEARVTSVELQNERLEKEVARLNSLLLETLSVDDYLDLDTLKQKPDIPYFIPPDLGKPEAEPKIDAYLPKEPTGLNKLLPGARKKYEQAVQSATARYKEILDAYHKRQAERQRKLDQAKAEHERKVKAITEEAEAHNAQIEEFRKDFAAGKPDAIVNYFTLVLGTSSYPEGFPQKAKIAYVPESKQLVVEYDLPPFSVIPEVGSYKYVKTKDEITTTMRPLSQRKSLYASVIAQVSIRSIHELFEADRTKYLETVVFNGYVDSIDKATGRPVRNCLVTVRTTRDIFNELDLSKVDPAACLKFLNASVSKSPDELAPVRPVLEFDMVDSRFVEETDVISTLDQRPNLMKLTPSEFESLITNLFEKMGLETRLTQASRDGGVDCVAYDPRPIFGGKVVIQAKRYKHTVGVSAVRDLYGTLQNEGASKGILVTTSGYGKAAFEFAAGKPIELLSGSNLLYLLSEHAGIEAKIEIPEDWKDPQMDVETE